MFKTYRNMVLIAVTLLSLLGAGLYNSSPVQAANPVVTGLSVEGNRYVPTDVILAAVKNTKVGDVASEEAIKKDLQSIAELGYFFDVKAHFVAEQNGARLVFTVVENPVVKDVVVTGEVSFPTGKAREIIGLQAGEILNVNKLHAGLKNYLEKIFEEHGIVTRISDISVDEQGVVKIKLAETKVGKIEITGNQKTKDVVIRRELKTKPGSVLNLKELQNDLRRVANLGFFDEVSRKFTETSSPDVTDLTIVVKERKTGSAGGGVSYSNSGIGGFIEVADQNFLGRGERVSIRWEGSAKKNTWDLGFYEPYLDSHGTNGGINLYNRVFNEEYRDTAGTLFPFDKKEVGGDITLGRRFDDFNSGSVRLKVADIRTDWTSAVPADMADSTDKTRSLTFTYANDDRDFFLRPTTGGRRQVEVEVAPEFLGNTSVYNRYETDLSQYYKVGWGGNQVLALHLNAGFFTGNVPVHQLFEVGGGETVRGYNYHDFEGTRKLVLNTEYRFKLLDNLQGAVFADAGDAWTGDKALSLGDLKTGYGLGIRVDTPVGVIRIDHAFGATGRQAQTYFSIGQAF